MPPLFLSIQRQSFVLWTNIPALSPLFPSPFPLSSIPCPCLLSLPSFPLGKTNLCHENLILGLLSCYFSFQRGIIEVVFFPALIETHRQTDRQTDGWMDRHTHKCTQRENHTYTKIEYKFMCLHWICIILGTIL